MTSGSIARSAAGWEGMFIGGNADRKRGGCAVSRCGRCASATAYRVHDLDAVARGERMLRVTAARHDLAVDLDGDAAPGIPRNLEQVCQRNRGFDFVLDAVQQDLHAH